MALNPNAKPLGQKSEQPARKSPAKRAPGKAVAVAKKDDSLPSDLSKAKAQSLTKKIQTGLEGVVDLLQQALQGRVWIALGHKSWDEYVKAEFPSAPLALPMEKRKPTVASLAERGWSTRAIAAATGESQSTIARDVKEGLSQNDSVASDEPKLPGTEGEPEVIDAEVVSEEPAERTVSGLDGKERTVTVKPVEKKGGPVVVNIVSEAKGIVKDLEALTVRAGKLFDRDDFEENAAAVHDVLRTAVEDFLTEVEAVTASAEVEPEPAV